MYKSMFCFKIKIIDQKTLPIDPRFYKVKIKSVTWIILLS